MCCGGTHCFSTPGTNRKTGCPSATRRSTGKSNFVPFFGELQTSVPGPAEQALTAIPRKSFVCLRRTCFRNDHDHRPVRSSGKNGRNNRVSRGIGRALAAVLKEHRATVIGISSRVEVQDHDLDQHLCIDLSKSGGPLPSLEHVDVLVNNAGVFIDKPGWPENDIFFAGAKSSSWKPCKLILSPRFRLCRLVLPALLARGHGRILNVSSGMRVSASSTGRPLLTGHPSWV